jgi:hypothetical protein
MALNRELVASVVAARSSPALQEFVVRYCRAGVPLAHIQHTGWAYQRVHGAHGAVRHHRWTHNVRVVDADIAETAVVESEFEVGTSEGKVDARA